jgi:hypothetical protein
LLNQIKTLELKINQTQIMETNITQPIKNGTTVLVLGICSIVFSCLFVGMILGIIGIVIGNTSIKLYKSNPTQYSGFGALNAGFIMSIIGAAIGFFYLIYYIFVGAAALSILSAAGI